ncbi:hypothetical protein B0T11DRAFT_299794 [Plectosphaerella cucumerina]|uniref:Uncharacterized protein n=1 Tax=Plectosphaerella cucumerina TaxID=40658 RepID=A0A8K0TBD9_9PEZI|nr:hypothetical protein B0T11DRAFT_299794 [Plectosphaerella cucumerina]
MCISRQIYFNRCGHLQKEWSHCSRYVAEARKLRYKFFPCLFSLTCPSTTKYMGWQDPGSCGRCLGRERIADWLCCLGGAPEEPAPQESVVLPNGGGYPVAALAVMPQGQLSSGRTSFSTQAVDVYGEPKRYSWLELKPLPLVPGTAQGPRAQDSATAGQEESSTAGAKASRDDVWPEGMSIEEYMEEVELLWKRASMKQGK